MTECPKCKGYGIVGSAVPDILSGRGAIFSSNECDMCHGSGEVSEVEMTNEEWFCSLSTEEKAKWITENITVYADDWVKSDEKLLNHATWVEWLKEKHE